MRADPGRPARRCSRPRPGRTGRCSTRTASTQASPRCMPGSIVNGPRHGPGRRRPGRAPSTAVAEVPPGPPPGARPFGVALQPGAFLPPAGPFGWAGAARGRADGRLRQRPAPGRPRRPRSGALRPTAAACRGRASTAATSARRGVRVGTLARDLRRSGFRSGPCLTASSLPTPVDREKGCSQESLERVPGGSQEPDGLFCDSAGAWPPGFADRCLRSGSTPLASS